MSDTPSKSGPAVRRGPSQRTKPTSAQARAPAAAAKAAAPRSAPAVKPAAPVPSVAADGPERIAKVLSRVGVASRRAAEAMIAEGRVSVNGRVLETPACVVTPADVILVDDQPIPDREPPRLWRYHKPSGLVTTARDEKGRETIFDHLPEGLPRVMPVGRLDLTSEGLLLLTNDGELKRRLELPSTGWLRRYRVRVHGEPTEAQLQPLIEGVVVDGVRYQPMLVAIDRQQGSNAWLTVGLTEGKNREIRRAMEFVGLPVSRLLRVSFGPFRLGELARGAVAEVKTQAMREHLKLDLATPQRRGSETRASGTGDPSETRSRAAGAKPKPHKTGSSRPERAAAEHPSASAPKARRGDAAAKGGRTRARVAKPNRRS